MYLEDFEELLTAELVETLHVHARGIEELQLVDGIRGRGAWIIKKL